MFIFLDVDGVLNTEKDWKNHPSVNEKCIRNLAAALSGTGAKIILTSSWRKGFISRNNPNNSPQIRMLEQALEKQGLSVRGTVNPDESDRLSAIREFLSKHPDKSIILDDDISEYTKRPENLLLTNSKQGFTEKDAQKLKRMIRNG